ncbi:septum formation protein Maf [candidate division KSB1 bacterium]|nr:septum formation protein Maf [candidate division KSB1 bacterium]MBL7093889.1 septum formation protein Maf [candidate division KSB1 bacterium]
MPLLNTESFRVILASKSPRRTELLKKIISHFEVKISNINENLNGGLSPQQFAVKLSQLKAQSISQNLDDGLIIGADSIVVLNNTILGKPKDSAEATEMLTKLSGKTHQVITGYSILKATDQILVSDHAVTDVKFRELTSREIQKYVKDNKPYDKAGAYGIQEEAGLFVEKINGCYFNVMGLPITKLYLVLKDILK